MDLAPAGAAVGAVFALLGLAVAGWGRPRGAGGPLAASPGLRLTPRHSLHRVQSGGRAWLVICHGAGATVVAEEPPAAENPGGTPGGAQ